MKQKLDFLLFKCPEKGKFLSPETGDEFRVGDVVGGSEELFTLSFLQCCNTSVEKTCLVGRWKVETISESDDMLSSVNSSLLRHYADVCGTTKYVISGVM